MTAKQANAFLISLIAAIAIVGYLILGPVVLTILISCGVVVGLVAGALLVMTIYIDLSERE